MLVLVVVVVAAAVVVVVARNWKINLSNLLIKLALMAGAATADPPTPNKNNFLFI